MFQSRKKNDEMNVKITEETKFFDVVKNISILLLVVIVGFVFVQKNYMNESMNGDDGVVFKNLSTTYSDIESSYNAVLLNKEDEIAQAETPENEVENKNSGNHNVFYIEYNGTLMASEVKYLKAKVDAIILKANENDEVLISVNSPGGAVSGYGLIASQFNRLKTANLKLTTVVDNVAASGGYMAAVVGDEIVAAPFAMVGSIGVVANVMIYEELLKSLGIETRVYTSGTSKRTVVPSRVPTEEEEAKLEKQLEEIHARFKQHILNYRPDIDPEVVFTGQAFLAIDAMNYGLIDKIGTSDELLLQHYRDGQRIIKVEYQISENFSSSITKQVSTAIIDTIKTEIYSNSLVIQ